LLFQPTTNGVDVMDGRLANLVNRVALSVSQSQNYDAFISDAVDGVLIAITGTGDGIAIVDLTSIKEGEHGIVLDRTGFPFSICWRAMSRSCWPILKRSRMGRATRRIVKMLGT